MSITPEQFFSKNMKWILLVVTILFFVKFVQSCNRNMTITTLNEKIVELNDSISLVQRTERENLLNCEKINSDLTYQVELAKSLRDEANKRADAVQSTAEKTRTNTTSTIVVKGAEQVQDSTKIKK